MAKISDATRKVLEKIASKRGKKDIRKVGKLISNNSRRNHMPYEVGLILEAKSHSIGTASLEKRLSDSGLAQLQKHLEKSVGPTPFSAKKSAKRAVPKKIISVIKYETQDPFIQGHVSELNKAYTNSCYTAAFILARKITENLIIDILKKKYPETSLQNKELYFDVHQKRLKDFGVILENLLKKKNDFGSNNKIVERLCNLANNLKDNTNDKVHSWYHLVKRRSEIDEIDLQTIIDLIVKLESDVGIR